MGSVRRGMHNAFRNVTRTVAVVLILALTFGLAIVMLISHEAAGADVNSVASNFGTTVTIRPAGSFGGFGGSQSGNPLTAADVALVAATTHVVAVDAAVTDRLTSPGASNNPYYRAGNGGTTSLTSPYTAGSLAGHGFQGGGGGGGGFANFTPPVQVIGSDTPLAASGLEATAVKLVAGTVINGASTSLDADVGQTLATKNDLQVGSTFTAYDKTITVAGIYSTTPTNASGEFVLPLKTEETLSDIDGVTTLVATVDTLANVQSTATALQSELGTTVATVTTPESGTSQTANSLNTIKSITVFSLFGALIAAAAILLMSMLMIVRERRREIGVLKAFGSSNVNVVSTFVVEAMTLTFMAAVLGTLLGFALSGPVANLLASSQNSSASSPFGRRFGGGNPFSNFLSPDHLHLHAVISGSVAIYAVLIAIGIAFVGSAVPAYASAKVRPAEVMRSE
jgi:putative ABC transport system permease protein